MTAPTQFDAARELLLDARVWEKQQPLLVSVGPTHFAYAGPTRDVDTPPHFYSLREVVPAMAGLVALYPSGLGIPVTRVNWFWEFENEVRQGNAEQALRYCIKKGIDPSTVFPVAPDRVHGTYIRYEGDREDGRDYHLVHARGFPAWAGV